MFTVCGHLVSITLYSNDSMGGLTTICINSLVDDWDIESIGYHQDQLYSQYSCGIVNIYCSRSGSGLYSNSNYLNSAGPVVGLLFGFGSC